MASGGCNTAHLNGGLPIIGIFVAALRLLFLSISKVEVIEIKEPVDLKVQLETEQSINTPSCGKTAVLIISKPPSSSRLYKVIITA